jgi:hypothetical protein
MCDGFLNKKKKNQDGCPDSPYHHPKRKRRNPCKFTRWVSRLKVFKNTIFKIYLIYKIRSLSFKR